MSKEYKTLRELFSNPERWTKHGAARDVTKKHILYPEDPCAVCWCMYGGMRKVYAGTCVLHTISYRLDRIVDHLGFNSYIEFNDAPDTTHEKLMKVLEEAEA